MTEIEEFEANLSEELKTIIRDVILELKTSVDEELNSLSQLNKDMVVKFFEDAGMPIKDEYLSQITTPFSLAKYLMLIVELDVIKKEVKSELEGLKLAQNITWTMSSDLTTDIIFSKELQQNSEEKPEQLTITFSKNKETDKIVYAIKGTYWGWNITLSQLKSLLEGKNLPSNKSCTNNTKKMVNTNEDIVIKTGNTEITIRSLDK